MPYAKPTVSPDAFIAENAVILGDVTVGAGCSVWFNATLRGDMGGKIILGERTNVQELACIHVPLGDDTVVGSDVSIGHGAILHGCTVGDGTLIGMGAIVLDGARIGKNCLVGAGALVTGTADIPDGMMVLGSPAKAVRPLREDELASLKVNSAEYVKAGRELADEGVLSRGLPG